jgi:GDPmannose 4,6-dehydratase
MRRALICGVSGQDGAYLAQYLLSKQYEVFGGSRDIVKSDFSNLAKLGIIDRVKLINLSIADLENIQNVLSKTEPIEIYNLAGQSSVGLSFERPEETRESIVDGTFNLLEAIRLSSLGIRFFNAGSGECFGDTHGVPANESTSFDPKSPYAEAKVAAFELVKNYRDIHGLFACTGILFNHESPLRPTRFVTQKIIRAAIEIANGSTSKLTLGNLGIQRDWGWSPEYVEAMWLMLQQHKPEDFVLATGVGNSLETFVSIVFEQLGLDWKEHVLVDQALFRLNEAKEILANPSKAKDKLGWDAKMALKDVIAQMLREAQKI